MFAPRPHDPPLAIALRLLATVFIAATTLLAKALGTDAPGAPLHPFQISHGRFLFVNNAIGLTFATLVFATLYDLAVLGAVPDAVSVAGAGVIVAGAALLAFREARLARAGSKPA